jgi:hypothetical protein
MLASMMADIPADLDAFLAWLKQRTEAAWADYPTTTLAEFEAQGIGGSSWRAGTRWQKGLDAGDIEALERTWNLHFPEDYRRFLRLLNAPDRGRYSVGWADEEPYGMQEDEDEPSCFDWRRDVPAIADALHWPLQGLLLDVERDGLWLPAWGTRPDTTEARRETVTRLVAAAPALVPVIGHRYLLGDPPAAGNPALSIWKSDIIVQARDLRGLLVVEFAELLGLDRAQAAHIAMEGAAPETIAAIPFWGELISRN